MRGVKSKEFFESDFVLSKENKSRVMLFIRMVFMCIMQTQTYAIGL